MVEEVKRAVAADDGAPLGTPLDPSDLDAISAVVLAGEALATRATALVQSAGYEALRPAHARLFARLQVGSQTVGELATALGVTPQAVSKALGPLVAAGYVAVRPGADSRTRLVSLEPRGREAVLAARAARAAVARDVGAPLERVRAELLELLDDLRVLDGILRRD